MTVRELLSQTSASPLEAEIDVQLQSVTTRETKGGKPFLILSLADATGSCSLNVWNNHPQWESANKDLQADVFLRFDGQWSKNDFGLDAKSWQFRLLNEGEIENLLAGDPATREKQETDWREITQVVDTISDPRLSALCTHFLDTHGEKFRRCAAARKNHHARRGGLAEHVAQMMRSARALHAAYPYLNLDLMQAAILFHDCGKLWENNYPATGFGQNHNRIGEMLGHIPLGLELINRLWHDLDLMPWQDTQPDSESVRLHLLHLVASHHGTHEFGSPTLPRSPEALVLHHIDNIDAKLEMLKDAYATSNELAPGIYERKFPLPTNLVDPLPAYRQEDGTDKQQ